MDANTARVEQIAASTAPNLCAPYNDRDRVIDTIARLLSSGQALPEILQHIKRTAEGHDTTQPNGAAEAGTQFIHLPDELRDTRPNSATIKPPEPVDVTLANEEVQDSTDALDPNASAVGALGLGTSDGQQTSQAPPVRRTCHIKLSGSIRAAVLLIIPAVSLAVMAVAGKALIDSGAVPNAAAVVRRAITETIQSGKSQPLLLRAEADKQAPRITEPDFPESKTMQPNNVEPRMAPWGLADPQTGQLNPSEPQLTSSQVRALLERGDALVSNADIHAARLSYEQAAAAGNAEAAIRLAATYDPAFLAQAGLRNVRGDMTIAQYWYQLAHALGPKAAQPPSIEARN